MTSSYQNRKREIRYLRQCIRELEDIATEFAKRLKEKGGKPFLLGKGIKSSDFITPYSDYFLSDLMR